MKKRCKSKYYDDFENATVRCDLKEGHTGHHIYYSWLPWGGAYKWDDTTAIKNMNL